jgi:hypothetical protein
MRLRVTTVVVLLLTFAAPIRAGAGRLTSVTVVASGDLAVKDTLDTEVSDFALTLAPDMTITLGDNNNVERGALCNESPCSAVDEYKKLFAPTWGRLPDIHPAPGNHDYASNYGVDYMTYFRVPPYYSLDVPGWHIISLNSQLRTDNGDYRAEQDWLSADLATVPTTTSVLAYWHYPLFSTSCRHLGYPQVRALWQILLAHGAKTLVANGDTHVYERYAPMNAGARSDSHGITQLEIGAGGAEPASCFVGGTPSPVVADLGAHVALFTLRSDGTYRIEVYRVPASGSARLIDRIDG